MRIDTIIDVVCPWCYIGKKQLDLAVAQRPDDVREVIYRPYQLGPDTPAEGIDRKLYYKQKFGDTPQFKAAREHMSTVGEELGIVFDWDRDALIPNTLDAHRLISWAQGAGCGDAVTEDLMLRYFTHGEFLGDWDLLVDVARTAGMDADLVQELLDSDRDVENVKTAVNKARGLGVTGVPCFYFNGQGPVAGAQEAKLLVQVIDQVSGILKAEAATK